MAMPKNIAVNITCPPLHVKLAAALHNRRAGPAGKQVDVRRRPIFMFQANPPVAGIQAL